MKRNDTLTRLTALFKSKKVFVREWKPDWLRSLGIALFCFGLSCRRTAEVFSFFDEASYETARRCTIGRKACFVHHRSSAGVRSGSIDEAKVKVEKRWYLWMTIDTDNREVLGIQLTPTRDGRDAFRFIRRELKMCTNAPQWW